MPGSPDRFISIENPLPTKTKKARTAVGTDLDTSNHWEEVKAVEEDVRKEDVTGWIDIVAAK